MTAPIFSDALGRIDDKYIQEALDYRKSKSDGIKWRSAAAGLVLALGLGSYVVYRAAVPSAEEDPAPPMLSAGEDPAMTTTPAEKDPTLPMLSAQMYLGGMGFEGLMFYDISESSSANPWNDELQLETLPVYRNLAYVDESGVTSYLTEEELLELAEKTAEALGEQITESKYDMLTAEKAMRLRAVTENLIISVEGNGYVLVEFSPAIALPEKYRPAGNKITEKTAARLTKYLSNAYSELINCTNPVADTWGDYSFSGDKFWRYNVYDKSTDDVQSILNYNFCKTTFSCLQNELLYVHINHKLAAAQKLGDYPIITSKEASEYLLEGKYLTSVPEEYLPDGGIREKDIAKIELIYQSGPVEIYMPYYRFYVELEMPATVHMAEGLKNFGAVYVPAVSGEYLTDFPPEIHFN